MSTCPIVKREHKPEDYELHPWANGTRQYFCIYCKQKFQK